MKKRIVAFLMIFLTLLSSVGLLITSSQSARAISPETTFGALQLPAGREDEWAENSFLFYNPNGSADCGGYTAGVMKPSGDEITWVGDSYSFQAENVHGKMISSKFPGVDLTAQGSKHWWLEGEGVEGGPSGLTILREKTDIRKYVVFALGTNDPSGLVMGSNDYMQQLMDIVGPNRTVILVTPRIRDKPNDYDTIINQMRDAASKYSNIIIADWKAAIEKAGIDGHYADALHPNKEGYEIWLQTIYDALPGGAGMLTGNTNAEKIWNYLVSANISGLSDNPMAIAGILGNMYAESGFDPFESGGTYYGLWQWNAAYGAAAMRDEVNQAVGSSSYWHPWYTAGTATQDKQDIALEIELRYLTTQSAFLNDYVGKLSRVATNSPESYAELFLVTIERAVNGEATILDSGVQAVCGNMYRSGNTCPYLYQGGVKRRKAARNAYDLYTNTNAIPDNLGGVASAQEIITAMRNAANVGFSITEISARTRMSDETVRQRNLAQSVFEKEIASGSKAAQNRDKANALLAAQGNTGVSWQDGWITDGSMPGMTKQALEGSNYTPAESLHKGGYVTADGKPNKILLHNTEGTGNGLQAYVGNMFPAHFTIDLKKKQAYQHFSIWEPSLALVGDTYGPIQIEIVGYVYGSKPSNEYDLSNFTAEDWDYLALLLTAIAEETGIPLTSSVEWENGSAHKFSSTTEFTNYRGICGHMHAPNNSHTDPGNIWPKVSEAIARNPNAAKFGYSSTSSICDVPGEVAGGGALISGGMTLAEADAFMEEYRQLARANKNAFGQGNVKHEVSGGLNSPVTIFHTSTCNSAINNCSSFSQYFVNKYTTAGPDITAWNGGVFVRGLLGLNKGFIDGGTTPKVYAVFSVTTSTTLCGGSPCGHTGVVLGIDRENDKIIIGEAGCSYESIDDIGAHEKSLSRFSNGAYKYAYTDAIINL